MIWFILSIGLMLRLISLNQSLWLDEAINVIAARNNSLYGIITQYATADFHPPGWFIILWSWGKIFGYSEIATRIPSVIFGVLTVWIVYLIGRKFQSRELGIIAALLLSINPLHIYYSQEARMYALATLAVSVNILLLLRLVKEEKLNLFFLILSDLLVLSSDYIAYFIFPAQLAFLLIIRKKEILRKWFIAFIAALLLGSWWLPVFISQLNVGSVASANLPTWKFVVGGFDFKTLPLTFVKFIIGRISLADKTMYALFLLPICGLFGYLIWRGVKFCNNIVRKLLIVWIIIPLVIATAISLVVPVYNYFRVLFIIPAFIILISLGVLSFKKKFKYIFLGIVVLTELFCTAVYLLNPAYQREDWRGLVNFFREKPALMILFESSGTLPPFDYYAEGKIKAEGALKDFPARTEKDVLDLGILLKNNKEVYLVDYLVQISDPQRLVARKLGALGYKQTEIINFNGVGFVYHFLKAE